VQEAFTPSAARIDKARKILTAFVSFRSIGAGAFSLDGNMIDMPTILVAHNVIKLARLANKIPADDMLEVDTLLLEDVNASKNRA
jgi:citrate lyase beta subunit